MKKDIILSGVGGQGILSIATVIGEAATAAGLYLKQAEVHGMSQRGGDVQSNLRLSTEPIYSDLIPHGKADLIISMEPMEALRYLEYLAEDGTVVTSSKALVNITDYPDMEKVMEELHKIPRLVIADTDEMAKTINLPKGANMILLGMAAPFLGVLSAEQLREALKRVFARKGDVIVEANCRCFDSGISLNN